VNERGIPHLHFQLVIDLLDLGCEFPSACDPAAVEVWAAFSPDPGLLLEIPESAVASEKNGVVRACLPAPGSEEFGDHG
jgi:hypothetical protein